MCIPDSADASGPLAPGAFPLFSEPAETLYLVVFTQFRTENLFLLFLELL